MRDRTAQPGPGPRHGAPAAGGRRVGGGKSPAQQIAGPAVQRGSRSAPVRCTRAGQRAGMRVVRNQGVRFGGGGLPWSRLGRAAAPARDATAHVVRDCSLAAQRRIAAGPGPFPQGGTWRIGNGGALGACGVATAASFNHPEGVAVSGSGATYVADFDDHKIRRINPNGSVATLVGTGSTGAADGTGSTLAGAAEGRGNTDGALPAARFARVGGIAIANDGRIFVADYGDAVPTHAPSIRLFVLAIRSQRELRCKHGR